MHGEIYSWYGQHGEGHEVQFVDPAEWAERALQPYPFLVEYDDDGTSP